MRWLRAAAATAAARGARPLDDDGRCPKVGVGAVQHSRSLSLNRREALARSVWTVGLGHLEEVGAVEPCAQRLRGFRAVRPNPGTGCAA